MQPWLDYYLHVLGSPALYCCAGDATWKPPVDQTVGGLVLTPKPEEWMVCPACARRGPSPGCRCGGQSFFVSRPRP